MCILFGINNSTELIKEKLREKKLPAWQTVVGGCKIKHHRVTLEKVVLHT